MVAKKHRRTKKKEPEYAFLAIAVDDYDVNTDARVNLVVRGVSRYLINDTEAVYSFDTALDLSEVCTYPDERAGDRYDISLRSSTLTPLFHDLRQVLLRLFGIIFHCFD